MLCVASKYRLCLLLLPPSKFSDSTSIRQIESEIPMTGVFSWNMRYVPNVNNTLASSVPETFIIFIFKFFSLHTAFKSGVGNKIIFLNVHNCFPTVMGEKFLLFFS